MDNTKIFVREHSYVTIHKLWRTHEVLQKIIGKPSIVLYNTIEHPMSITGRNFFFSYSYNIYQKKKKRKEKPRSKLDRIQTHVLKASADDESNARTTAPRQKQLCATTKLFRINDVNYLFIIVYSPSSLCNIRLIWCDITHALLACSGTYKNCFQKQAWLWRVRCFFNP